MSSRLPSVQHVAVGQVGVGTLWWTGAVSELNLTICAKACFRMVHGGDMQLVDPAPLNRDERRASPTASVSEPADLLPRLPLPEVTLSGSARGGPDVSRRRVRLALLRDGRTVLDKRLDVVGDRDGAGEPKPFASMPLTYERALGGIGFAANPLGRGANGAGAPNVLDASSPTKAVGCFAPVPAAFAVRKRRLGAKSARELARAPMAIPGDFDWQYFQSAPADQRVAAIAGDEWIWLEGLRDDHKHFRSRLPETRAAARLYGTAGASVPDYVPLRAESLHIDAERGVCSLVWRGSYPCMTASTSLIVAVGLSVGGATIAWPTTSEQLTALMVEQCEWLPDDQLLAQDGDTIVISNREEPPRRASPDHTTTVEATPRDSPTMPFAKGDPPAPRSAPIRVDIPGAPWSRDRGQPVEAPPAGVHRTVTAHGDPEHDAEQRALARALERRRAELLEADKKRLEAEQAEARRAADAQRFHQEQEAARRAASEREAAKREEKTKVAAKLMSDLYGGFKR
jgi:hypothetical protein